MPQSDSDRYEQLAATLHRLIALYGYERLETPVLQPAELFLTRAGDQVISRLFTFERNGRQVALRPEYTSSAVSQYIELHTSEPARWQFGGLVFEDAEEAGRQQHYSIGAEVFGIADGLADAEVIHLALTGLAQAGLSDGKALVGHVGLLRLLVGRFVTEPRLKRFLLNHVQVLRQPDGELQVREQLERLLQTGLTVGDAENVTSPSPAVMDALLQSLERTQLMGGRTREDIQRRLQRKLERAESRPQIEAALALLRDLLPLEGDRRTVVAELRQLLRDSNDGLQLLDQWARVLEMTEQFGVPEDAVTLAPALSRNWDYYTGIVFELRGGGQHVGGGGRYDDLARLLGASQPVPAVGFAYYVDNLLRALPPPADARRVWSLTCTTLTPAVRAWLSALRGRGIAVALIPSGGVLTVDDAGRLRVWNSAFALDDAAQVPDFLEVWS